jgi:hypothetical protein
MEETRTAKEKRNVIFLMIPVNVVMEKMMHKKKPNKYLIVKVVNLRGRKAIVFFSTEYGTARIG